MLEVQEFNDVAKLGGLRPAWNQLLAETEDPDFFRTLCWLETYWKHYGAGQKLRVLAIKKDNRVVGILPLTVAKRHTRIGRLRVLEFPLDFWGSFFGTIGPSPKQTLRAGLKHLLHSPRDWDYINLRWLRDSPNGAGALVAAAGNLPLALAQLPDDGIALADLRTGWDAYWSSRSGNWRSNCRRNAKKTEAAGEVDYIRYRPCGARHDDGDPRWDLYEEVLAIANRSWQGRSKDGTTMSHRQVKHFLRDVHLAAAREGHLDINLLRINGKSVAYNYNYHYRGYVSSLRLGFDPAYADCGVGTVLTWRMLQDSCRRGDHTVDFLPGSSPVKRPWQTSVQESLSFEHLPLRWGRVALILAKRWVGDRWRTAREHFSLSG